MGRKIQKDLFFIDDILHVSMPFSQIFPPSSSLSESIRLFYTSVSLFLSYVCKSEKKKTSEGRNEEKTKIQRGKQALKLVFITGINLPIHGGLGLRFFTKDTLGPHTK